MEECCMREYETGTDRRATFSEYIFFALAWLFLLCIVIQTFLAGLGMFTDSTYFKQHAAFVHFFEFLPLLMLIFAFTGKLRASFKWQTLGLFLLIYSQYITANLPVAGAMHPVIALLLFYFSIRMVIQLRKAYAYLPPERREG